MKPTTKVSLSMQSCSLCKRVAEIKNSQPNATKSLDHKRLIHEFPNSFLLVGDHGFYKGYSVLILKNHFQEITDLSDSDYLKVMTELKVASLAIGKAFLPQKLNHASLGNVDPHVHWHIFPRYLSDPNIKLPPWANASEFEKHPLTDSYLKDTIQKIQKFL